MSRYADVLSEFANLLANPALKSQFIPLEYQSNLTIYRNNIQLNRLNALKLAYPTVEALLGDEFFAAMALIYIEQTPVQSANLNGIGGDFAVFIAQFEPAADLPYLSDVARLDWARHCAHYAKDAKAISAQELAQYAEQFAALRFALHPAVAIIESIWPIGSILKMHHGGTPPADLNTAENVLVWRDQYCLINAAQTSLLKALQAGIALGIALERTSQINAQFDPSETISLLLEQNLITQLN